MQLILQMGDIYRAVHYEQNERKFFFSKFETDDAMFGMKLRIFEDAKINEESFVYLSNIVRIITCEKGKNEKWSN